MALPLMLRFGDITEVKTSFSQTCVKRNSVLLDAWSLSTRHLSSAFHPRPPRPSYSTSWYRCMSLQGPGGVPNPADDVLRLCGEATETHLCGVGLGVLELVGWPRLLRGLGDRGGFRHSSGNSQECSSTTPRFAMWGHRFICCVDTSGAGKGGILPCSKASHGESLVGPAH